MPASGAGEAWGYDVGRHSVRVSRAGALGVAVTALLVAGGTAAYSLGGRRSPAAADAPVAEAAPVATALRASVAEPTVAYGRPVRVAGLLRDASGAALPGRSVEVVAARADAPANAVVVATPMTDWRGRVSATFRPAAGSAVWLRYGGAIGLEPSESTRVEVAVAAAVTMRAKTARAGNRWTTTLRGVVKPAKAGQRVRLDRRTPAGWRPVSTARLTEAGGYVFRVTTTTPGAYRYRVMRPAQGAFAAGATAKSLRLRAPRAPRLPAGRSGNGGPGDLLVTGDSFAYYLGQQLATARKPRATTVESRPSSGLARPDYYDWMPRARQQAATKPGAVVVFLGANDCQPIRVDGTGGWVKVGTTAWIGEYRRRAAALMRVYTGAAVRPVYWVGLPIAERPDIASCYRAMNAATAAAARGVRRVAWVDTWAMYAVDGRYSVQVNGVVARQDDGIHLTFDGTRFLTRTVYALLRP